MKSKKIKILKKLKFEIGNSARSSIIKEINKNSLSLPRMDANDIKK